MRKFWGKIGKSYENLMKYEKSGNLAHPGLWGWLHPCVDPHVLNLNLNLNRKQYSVKLLKKKKKKEKKKEKKKKKEKRKKERKKKHLRKQNVLPS